MEYKSLEGRWDILYRDYPEVYDEFAAIPKTPDLFPEYAKKFKFKDKIILDIGSGTGLSSFAILPYCKSVIGVEAEEAMIEVAQINAMGRNVTGIQFIQGLADSVPLEDNSADISLAISLAVFDPDEIRRYVKEQMRVVKPGGMVIKMDIAPGWYGGDMAPILLGPSRTTDVDTEGTVDKILRQEFSFQFKDYYQTQEYGSVDKICRTYGFIFGQKAIDYFLKKKKTKIKWKSRVFYKQVEKAGREKEEHEAFISEFIDYLAAVKSMSI
jgi:ubiquinone/menaquinone biosynthesis C-methylase UbiE